MTQLGELPLQLAPLGHVADDRAHAHGTAALVEHEGALGFGYEHGAVLAPHPELVQVLPTRPLVGGVGGKTVLQVGREDGAHAPHLLGREESLRGNTARRFLGRIPEEELGHAVHVEGTLRHDIGFHEGVGQVEDEVVELLPNRGVLAQEILAGPPVAVLGHDGEV